MSKIIETIMFLTMFFGIILFFLFGAAIVEEGQRIQEADQEFDVMTERVIEALDLDLDYIYEEGTEHER